MPVIVNIAGYPGVGKSTVGRLVAEGLKGRFVANHDSMAPAFALFDVGSPDWWSLVESIRCSTLLSATSICADTSIVFTNVLVSGQARDRRLIEQLAILGRRNDGLLAFTLIADEDVRRRRLTDPARLPPKLVDWKIGQQLPIRYALADDYFYESVGAAHQIIDTTELSAAETASGILDAIGSAGDMSAPEMAPGTITITGVRRARRIKRQFDAVITIEDPQTPTRWQLRFHQLPQPIHLLLAFEDLDEAHQGIVTATEDHVEQAIVFGRQFEQAKLLIHCHAGIARSTAIALAIIADRCGPGREAEALEQMLQLQPEAVPNLMVMRHADRLLNRQGALLACVIEWDRERPWNRRRREINRAAVLDGSG